MTTPVCDRQHPHSPHDVTDDGDDYRCFGVRRVPTNPSPAYLAARAAGAGLGNYDLDVMSA